MSIAVLIPTYRRSKDLARCLEALAKQTRLADEIIIIVRDTDTETWDFLNGFNSELLPLRIVTVKVPGVVAAMNAGLDLVQSDIVAITDDDAAPHADWLESIEAYYLADDRLGGVGGRDWLYFGTQLYDATTHPGASQVVGKLQWYGGAIGNHHIGEGEPREVDVLKGVNSSYRSSALKKIRFDKRLRGSGAQVYWELSLCLQLKRAGWKLIYDPAVAVDHLLGERFDEDRRIFDFNAQALENAAHNETLVLLEHHRRLRLIVYITWAILAGNRLTFGLLQWLRFLPSEGNLATKKLLASMRGRWQGWQTWQKMRDRSFASSLLSTRSNDQNS